MPPGPEGEEQEGSGSDAIQMGLCGLESEAFRQSLILQAAREIHAPPRPLPTSQTHPSHNAAWNASEFIMAITHTTYRRSFIEFRSTRTSGVH